VREVNHASGDITIIAGDGTAGYSGDNGQATAAELYYPSGVAFDSNGDLFIADTWNNRVREVNLSTGAITTVAGNGTGGFSGNGGQATAAELNSPEGVAVDSNGNLFIADTDNNRVREVVSTGVISTAAGNGTAGYSGDGGQATAAKLNSPEDVAVDSSGNLFIADTNNNRVRKVNVSTHVITTVAGKGTAGYSGDGGQATAAKLNSPEGVAVDSSGNLFIADTNNGRIRKVTTSGVINTAAGNGTAGYGGDGGQATAAELNCPGGVAVDSSGDVFIADTNNNRVREVNNASKVISTSAGNGVIYTGDGGQATAAQLDFPQSVAADANGDLFIADTFDDVVREVNGATGVITTVAGDGSGISGYSGDDGQATAAKLDHPEGVAVDSSGDLFIADMYNNAIREVNLATGVITTVAGDGFGGYSGDGGPASAAELFFPAGLAVDSGGDLFIADSGNNAVREINHVTGDIATVAGTGTAGFSGDGGRATAAELNDPCGVAVDSNGNLFIADSGNNRVREVSGGVITTVAGNGTAGYSGDGGQATAAELNGPCGVAVDSNGDLFIADTFNQAVREVSLATGVITTVAGTGNAGYSGNDGLATDAQLHFPNAVAVDAAGNLYIADEGNNVIRIVTPGVLVTVEYA
jgi:sugar lactone lactonase YvrE